MNNKALLLLENAYMSYITKETSEKKMCKDIEVALSSMPFDGNHKEFIVQVVKSSTGDKFFGMRVFPVIEELDAFCDSIIDTGEQSVKFIDITRRWKNIKKWCIELDSHIFDRSVINFTPKELTALTLHELGHVIYSDAPLENFYRAYLEAKSRLNNAQKATQKLMYNIYMIPLSIACMQRRWVNGKNQINVEIIADRTVSELGYGEYLVEAFNKIMRTFGSMNYNQNQQEAEVATSVNWCCNNIADVMKRKENLKDELYYQAIKTKSNYMKAISIIILDKLGFKMRERYNGYAVENTIELLSDPDVLTKYAPIIDALESAKFDRAYNALFTNNDIAIESVFNKRKKIKVELPSHYDVDAIAVEVDKITNHYDRIFVLDLIYEVLERVNNFEEAISIDPALVKKWDPKITAMKNSLDVLREATLNKKSFDKKYKFFVKVPEGYEG